MVYYTKFLETCFVSLRLSVCKVLEKTKHFPYESSNIIYCKVCKKWTSCYTQLICTLL